MKASHAGLSHEASWRSSADTPVPAEGRPPADTVPGQTKVLSLLTMLTQSDSKEAREVRGAFVALMRRAELEELDRAVDAGAWKG